RGDASDRGRIGGGAPALPGARRGGADGRAPRRGNPLLLPRHRAAAEGDPRVRNRSRGRPPAGTHLSGAVARVRILAVGDSFMSADVFRRGLAPLAVFDTVDYLQVDAARTPTGLPISEYEGDPREIAERIAGVEVLVVHGAPVTAEVLDAADA